MKEKKLSEIYNEWANEVSKDWVGEYDELLGDYTLGEAVEVFKNYKDPYDVDDSIPVADAIFWMDTVCRTPIWNAIYDESK